LLFISRINTHIDTGADFYKEWPSHSPTVNISWFIAKAYLANLYFTTKWDVSLTIKTCDDIIDVSKQSSINLLFEKTFPVILSTQWTSIYDKEIQEMLGFYSLASYLLDKSNSSSVYLGISPVQFALYVKVRTNMEMLRKGPNYILNYVRYKFTYVQDYFEQESANQCENNVNSILPTIFNRLHYP